MTSKFFGRQRECRFYTAGCGNKMAVSVTGPRAVNELGGPVTPGTVYPSIAQWCWHRVGSRWLPYWSALPDASPGMLPRHLKSY